MGSSSLQSFILTYLVKQIIKFLDTDDKYWLFFSELGIHIDKNNNRACDVALYELNKSNISIDDINEHYINLPPQIVIEVDIKADLADMGEYEYIRKKTQSLHEFGTERVIWILTHAPSIIVAPKGESWTIHDIDTEINIADECNFNIGDFFKKHGKNLKDKGSASK
jgi:Uma2 family endonuclease